MLMFAHHDRLISYINQPIVCSILYGKDRVGGFAFLQATKHQFHRLPSLNWPITDSTMEQIFICV